MANGVEASTMLEPIVSGHDMPLRSPNPSRKDGALDSRAQFKPSALLEQSQYTGSKSSNETYLQFNVAVLESTLLNVSAVRHKNTSIPKSAKPSDACETNVRVNVHGNHSSPSFDIPAIRFNAPSTVASSMVTHPSKPQNQNARNEHTERHIIPPSLAMGPHMDKGPAGLPRSTSSSSISQQLQDGLGQILSVFDKSAGAVMSKQIKTHDQAAVTNPGTVARLSTETKVLGVITAIRSRTPYSSPVERRKVTNRKPQRNQALASEGISPSVASLDDKELALMKHAALFALFQSKMVGTFVLEDMIEFAEVKKIERRKWESLVSSTKHTLSAATQSLKPKSSKGTLRVFYWSSIGP